MKTNKFEKKIKENIVRPFMDVKIMDGYGIVLSYDNIRNEASVLMAQNGTDMPGDTHHNVPCPVVVGVQSVSPQMGRQCWVTFKNGDVQFPTITHFYNYYYNEVDYQRQTRAIVSVPRFIHGL